MSRSLILAILFALPGAALAKDIEIVVPSQSDFRAVSSDIVHAISYKALAPAEAGGITGFEIGIVGSYVPVDNEAAWQTLTTEDVSAIGIVGLRVLKGLPLNIDVGAFYTAVPEFDISVYGAEVRYAILPGSTIMPALAVRGAYTKVDGIDDFDVDAASVDVSLSKGFAILTPFIGAGYVWGKSDPHDVIGLEKEDIKDEKLFAGLRIALTLFYLTPEVDIIGGDPAYSVNVGIGF